MIEKQTPAWRIERTLWKMPLSRSKDEVVEEVMQLIRASFITKADLAATIEKLRIPDVADDAGSDRTAFGYNMALDTVMVSLVGNNATPYRKN